MHYDIAIKRLMELGGTGILREVVGLVVSDLEILDELPQEQTALLRCDYAAQFTGADGAKGIVLVEFQTRWDEDKILDFVAYTVQRMRRHSLPVVPVMLLFNPHPTARETFQRGPIRDFQFRLVKIWEIEANHLLATGQPWLWALSPLTHDGVAAAEKVDILLHEASHLSQSERSDLLTIFAIFMSMRDKDVTLKIIQRRRQLMIESPFYEMIKQEGREEGIQEGQTRAQRSSLLDVLSAHVGELPDALISRIEAEPDPARLRKWFQAALKCNSVSEFESVIAE